MRILVINPGSTSTKIAVYDDGRQVWMSGTHHKPSETARLKHVNEQYAMRMEYILSTLEHDDIPLRFDGVIARGGLLKPTRGGVYEVNEAMRRDLQYAEMEHASNLGGLLADEIARKCGCPAFIADPVVVDEMVPMARITGLAGMERKSIFHALNSKAVSRRYAQSVGKRYEELKLIVAHIGGGISVSAHCNGRVIDVNNALNGDGPFSPERAGTLPALQLAELCFSGRYTLKDVKKLLSGRGGLISLLRDNDVRNVAAKAEEGYEPYRTVVNAMMYNVAKQTGAMHVTLQGRTDAIIITGGIAFSHYCMSLLKPQVEYLAPVVIMPGENEMEALAINAFGALNGTMPVLTYPSMQI